MWRRGVDDQHETQRDRVPARSAGRGSTATDRRLMVRLPAGRIRRPGRCESAVIGRLRVDLLSQPGDLHVDDVVERRGAARFSPHFSRQHLARDHVALMAQQVLEQLELARPSGRAGDRRGRRGAPRDPSPDRRLSSEGLGRTATPQQGTDPSQQFRHGERLDKIIVRAGIQAGDAVFDAIARGQNQDRRSKMPLSQRLQDLEAAASRQHQIEDDQVEGLALARENPSSPVRATTTS